MKWKQKEKKYQKEIGIKDRFKTYFFFFFLYFFISYTILECVNNNGNKRTLKNNFKIIREKKI